MKNLFYIICMILCLISCTDSKYRLKCKTIDNEALADTVIIVPELTNGNSAYVKIGTRLVQCVDTCYIFYYPIVEHSKGTRSFYELRTAKPINFISLTYIKE